MTLSHLDETGEPCTRHRPGDLEALLQLAVIGARLPSFNHDIASKIQGVMMAIDEISELATAPAIQEAAQTAQAALGELNQLLQQSRALTKLPVATRIEVRELMTHAAQRVGVTLKGAWPQAAVEVAVPMLTQGLALALDAVAGTDRRRTLELRAELADGQITLGLPFAATTVPNLGDSLAMAAFIVTREKGELRCSAAELVLTFPVV